MHRNKGFSLIELMITVAIIGILSMMALPLYKSYIFKLYIMEGVSITASDRLEMFQIVNAQPEDIASKDRTLRAGANYYRFDTEMPNDALEATYASMSTGNYAVNRAPVVQIRFTTRFGVVSPPNPNIPEGDGGRLVYYLIKPSLLTTTTSNGYTTLTFRNNIPDADYTSSEGWKWICGIEYLDITNPAELNLFAAVPRVCQNIIIARN